MRRIHVVAAFAAPALFAASRALAQPARPSASADAYPDFFIEEEPRPKTLALEMNPLAVAIGRFSANIEYMLAEHHAAVVSPHYYYALPGRDDEITGGGIELGYRYYTGTTGPEGWFLGGSVLFGKYRYLYRKTGVDPGSCIAFARIRDCPDDTSYDSYGLAIDGGYQILLQEHLVLGAGVGAEYRAFTTQPIFETVSRSHQDLVYGSGLRPRFLLVFGGAL